MAEDPSPPRVAPIEDGAVLGGGGFTGGVYQIGALRALDLLTVNRTVNDFDIYIGTSAVYSYPRSRRVASPPRRCRGSSTARYRPRERSASGRSSPNYSDFATRGMLFPLRLAGLMRMVACAGARSADGRRRGPGRGAALRNVHGRVSGSTSAIWRHRPDERFLMLESELYLTATDLDTCERVVFGASGGTTCRSPRPSQHPPPCPWSTDRSRSRGASSSTAGFARRRTSTSRSSAEQFIVVVNPLVPYVNDFQKRSRRSSGVASGGSRTWDTRRSATRHSSCSPTRGCTSTSSAGASATPAWT